MTATNEQIYFCEEHPTQRLTKVCLNVSCVGHGLLCLECCTTSHSGHETISIEHLFELVQQIHDCHLEQSIDRNLKEWQEEIRAARITCLTDIRFVRETIHQRLLEMETRMMVHFQEAEEAISMQMQRLQRVFPKYQKVDLTKPLVDVKQKIVEMTSAVSLYAARKQDIINTAKQCLATTKDEHRKVQALLFEIDTFTKEKLTEVACFPHRYVPGDSQEKAFSQEMKHSDIVLTNSSVAIRKHDTTGGQQLFGIILGVSVMGATTLTMASEGVHRCCIRVLQVCGQIFVGIALQDRSKVFGFEEQDWVKRGHGNYLVSNHGRCYSHSDKAKNGETCGLQFGKGDTLELKMDAGCSQLVISTGIEEVQFAVEKPKRKDRYRFVVYLMCKGDCVEIIDI